MLWEALCFTQSTNLLISLKKNPHRQWVMFDQVSGHPMASQIDTKISHHTSSTEIVFGNDWSL